MFDRGGEPTLVSVTDFLLNEIDGFSPKVPLIVGLLEPGLRERHFEELQPVFGGALTIGPNLDKPLAEVLSLSPPEAIEPVKRVRQSCIVHQHAPYVEAFP